MGKSIFSVEISKGPEISDGNKINIFGKCGVWRCVLHPQTLAKLKISLRSCLLKYCRFWPFGKKWHFSRSKIGDFGGHHNHFYWVSDSEWGCKMVLNWSENLQKHLIKLSNAIRGVYLEKIDFSTFFEKSKIWGLDLDHFSRPEKVVQNPNWNCFWKIDTRSFPTHQKSSPYDKNSWSDRLFGKSAKKVQKNRLPLNSYHSSANFRLSTSTAS